MRTSTINEHRLLSKKLVSSSTLGNSSSLLRLIHIKIGFFDYSRQLTKSFRLDTFLPDFSGDFQLAPLHLKFFLIH